jgi:hypothetical protein
MVLQDNLHSDCRIVSTYSHSIRPSPLQTVSFGIISVLNPQLKIFLEKQALWHIKCSSVPDKMRSRVTVCWFPGAYHGNQTKQVQARKE